MALPEIDYMEGCDTDANAQAAYVTNASAASLLVGTDATGNATNGKAEAVFINKFTASANGVVTKLRVYGGTSAGNVKVALYADSSGTPTTLLASASGAVATGQWNDYVVSPITITSGSDYWLCWIQDTTQSVKVTYGLSGKTRKDKVETYATYSYPSTFDLTGFTPDGGTEVDTISAYGVTFQSYSESTIKTQGSYALKIIAAATDSLNKTLTHAFGTSLDLSGQNRVGLDLCSNRTGANLKFGLRNAVVNGVVQSQTNGDTNLGRIGDSENTEYREAQSFQLPNNLTITAVEVKQLEDIGTPSGNWTLRIETDSSGVPSGTLANANASIVVTPPGANTIVKGTFATPFDLNGSTTYWLVIDCDNQAANTGWQMAGTGGNPYANGRASQEIVGTGWDTGQTNDFYFKVYANTSNTATTELTPTISSADTFETKAFDLSGVADVDKNNITELVITPVNADAANTAYIDRIVISQVLTATYEETITLSEIFRRGMGRYFTIETITLSEVFRRGITKNWIEQVTLTEYYQRKASLFWIFSDEITLTEVFNFYRIYFKEFLDDITLTDLGITRSIGKNFTEQITLTEIFRRAITRSFIDIVILTEVGLKSIQLVFTELVTLSENFVKGLGKRFTETVTLTESFRRAITRTWRETITLTEIFGRTTIYRKLFIDQITLTEVFRWWKSIKPKGGTWNKRNP